MVIMLETDPTNSCFNVCPIENSTTRWYVWPCRRKYFTMGAGFEISYVQDMPSVAHSLLLPELLHSQLLHTAIFPTKSLIGKLTPMKCFPLLELALSGSLFRVREILR